MKRAAYSPRKLSIDQLESRLLLDGAAPFLDGGVTATAVPVETLYVSVNGDDSNSGLSPQAALRTIKEAVRQTQPGTTVFVLPGVYPEHIVNMPGGSSWDTAVRLAAYDPRNPPIVRPNAGDARAMTFASANSSYIEIDGFVIDAVNVEYDAVKITNGSLDGASHHIRLQNSEIRNSPGQGILVTTDHNEFRNLEIHNNGVDRFTHGIYIQGDHNLVESSLIHSNGGWGIHNYGRSASNNVYRHNVVTDNDRAQQRAAGIGVYTGTNIQVYGNTVSGSFLGIAVSSADVDISRNTVFDNETYGISVRNSPITVADNDVFDNGNSVWFDFPSLDGVDIEFAMVDAYTEATADVPFCSGQIDVECSAERSDVNQTEDAASAVGQPTLAARARDVANAFRRADSVYQDESFEDVVLQDSVDLLAPVLAAVSRHVQRVDVVAQDPVPSLVGEHILSGLLVTDQDDNSDERSDIGQYHDSKFSTDQWVETT